VSETLFELAGVSKRFRRGDTTIHAVDSVDLTIVAAEFVALEGPSGSGKTSLLQLLGTLDRPDAGQIFLEGREIQGLGDGPSRTCACARSASSSSSSTSFRRSPRSRTSKPPSRPPV
jgi:ABC-type lipoprotein export system ATPase subunit